METRMNTEKRMSITDSIFIKLAILGCLIIGILWLDIKSSHSLSLETVTWLYSLAGLLGYLMFGILYDRLKPKNFRRFLNANLILAGVLFVVFLISWSEVFTGPGGYLCRWPFLVCAIVIVLACCFGFLADFFEESESVAKRLTDLE